MAKAKSKKKSASDMKNEKLGKRKQSTNPFEVHVNKQKFNVLGRKLKQDRGLPGLARAKSIKKRRETLLQEYKQKYKANKFLDRRIGERNSAMTNEDKILARFAAERLRSHKKKAMFNLGEDEVLTHKGRSLAEIENFENPSSDDEDEHSKGKLDASFVEEAHFGGGLLKKADESKGRATVIEQLIAESKKRKAEKQEAKEKTLEKTEQLDSEWRELMPMVAGTKAGGPVTEEVEKKDPYDLIMSELKFEARGTPSDRLKSESELAAEEAKRLRELEEERLRRMKGEDLEVPEVKAKKQHRSADDLDDGFELQEDEEFVLMYDKEGNFISKIKDDGKAAQNVSRNEEDENAISCDEEEEEEEEEHDGDDEKKEEDTADKTEGEKDSDSDSDGEAIFDLSDMVEKERKDDVEVEIEEEEDEEEDEDCDKAETEENKVQNEDVKINKKQNESENTIKETSSSVTKEGENLNKKKVAFNPVVKTIEESFPMKTKNKEELEKENEEKRKLMEQAKSELPFTFKIPEMYQDLYDLLEDKNMEQLSVIIERMIKCNHPSLNEKNKAELNKLFAFLLQFINDADHLDCWSILNVLAPYLFELAHFSSSNAVYCLSEVISEKHSEYLEKKHRYPSYETLVFLKLIPLLFPTSDKRHPITTPAIVFITEMLHQCQVTTRRAITSGLFLVTLFTQYITLSKRILPEAINFLCGIIHLATPAKSINTIIVPPFQKDHKFLYLHQPFVDLNEENLSMLTSDLAPKSVKIDNNFRVRSVFTTLNLLSILIESWKDIPGIWLLLSPILDHITALEVNKYPAIIGKNVEKLKNILNEIKNKGLEPVIQQQKKPKALRLYDPNIQPVYENRKRKYDDNKSESKKLLTKYKREMKGALREIRRDRSFLADVKFKEIAKSDETRMKKVKEIYSMGSQQQGELNKLARQKRRKK